MTRCGTLILALALGVATPALAQSDPPSKQSLKEPGCNKGSTAEAATKPAPASADGTSPGNSGSSGWSGGLGGSYLGTAPAGGTKDSKTFQPATARGLDLMGAPPKAENAC